MRLSFGGSSLTDSRRRNKQGLYFYESERRFERHIKRESGPDFGGRFFFLLPEVCCLRWCCIPETGRGKENVCKIVFAFGHKILYNRGKRL